jgi:CubicO group peptidase (beta-lactamase class C family)
MFTRRELLIGSGLAMALPRGSAAEPRNLSDLLETIRTRYGLPGVAAVVADKTGILANGVCGVRKMGEPGLIPPTAHWQLGSITKTFTATLTAILVQRGLLKWESTLREIYPEHVRVMASAVPGITVKQLVTHHSGFGGDVIPWEGVKETNAPNLTLSERRQHMAVLALKTKPSFPPGEKYEYSNQGYNLLGAALEKVSGKPWEELIRTEIAKPLGIASLVFGEPALERPAEEPWPHEREKQRWKPVPPVPPKMYGYFVCNPAGGVSLALPGVAKWVHAHLKGSGILDAESFHTIHTSLQEGGVPAFGVGTGSPALGRTLTHSGSNGRNFANLMILPDRGLGVFLAVNAVPPDDSPANWALWNTLLATALPGKWPTPATTPPSPSADGMIEGEALEVVRIDGGSMEFQEQASCSGKFQLWWAGAKDGNKLVVRFRVPRAGRYTIQATCAKNSDYGDATLALGNLSKRLSFKTKALRWDAVDLGDVDLTAGPHDLTVTAHGSAGQNGVACHLGLDVLTIRAVR